MNSKEFGKEIPFVFAASPLPEPPRSFCIEQPPQPLEEKFASLTTQTPFVTVPKETPPEFIELRSSGDGSWLKIQCEHLFGREEAPAMAVALFEMLRTTKSSEQLQGELFDLVGDR